MKKLQILHLSYIQKLLALSTSAILSAPLSRDIDTLLLRNIQTFKKLSTIPNLDFRQLFSGLNRPRLEVFDLIDNAFTSLSTGVTLMTRLRKLALSENLLFSASFFRYRIIEILLHPSLQEVSIADQELMDKYLGDTDTNTDSLGAHESIVPDDKEASSDILASSAAF